MVRYSIRYFESIFVFKTSLIIILTVDKIMDSKEKYFICRQVYDDLFSEFSMYGQIYNSDSMGKSNTG